MIPIRRNLSQKGGFIAMKQFIVKNSEQNLRLDQYLVRLLPGAGKSFLYKMLRKKNITWNGKKAQGSERLQPGDEIKIFFSDETFELFRGHKGSGRDSLSKGKTLREAVSSSRTNTPPERTLRMSVRIVYEDADILIADKPAGVLSQKAQAGDYSINDWFLAYCEHEPKSPASVPDENKTMLTYTPSVANRLDRNTSGMILCGKTLAGARYLSSVLKNHSLQKYYLAVVHGRVSQERDIDGYLMKNERTNQVFVSEYEKEGSSRISTGYRPLAYLPELNITLIEVLLKTGKTHQIRAHLSSIGHALVGDPKYGISHQNEYYRKRYGLKRQLLHCYKVIFPKENSSNMQAAGKTFLCAPPKDFIQITGDIYGNLEFPRS